MTDPRFSEKFYKEKLPFARELAAQAWCKKKTKHKDMDPDLAEAFAEILVNEMYLPALGCAKTGELLDEIRTRIELDGKLDYTPIREE